MSRERIVRTDVRDGVLQIRRPGTAWLSTGYDGGRSRGECAYVLSVPERFERTDLQAYVEERLAAAGFESNGPALLTGVPIEEARIARVGPAATVATAGISNPAALFPDPEDASAPTVRRDDSPRPGTVNVVTVVDRALPPGALANAIAVAAEAKAATLSRLAGVPGTTSDAVVVGCDPDGDPARFSGSATTVGSAIRATVRDAVSASFDVHYRERDPPASVAEARYGVVTNLETEVDTP